MIIPYITFCGECREVLEFYRTVFNGTVRMLQTYGSYVPENVDAYINLPPTETFYSAFHGGITDKHETQILQGACCGYRTAGLLYEWIRIGY